jgi:hypothetical protein
MESLPERKQERCASCGKFKDLALYPPNTTDHVHLFCVECIRRLDEGEQLYLVFTLEYEPPSPPEEGFWWLFKAARALIKKGVIDEDQILPTLVFAHEIDRRAAGGAAAASFETGSPLMPHVWHTVERVDGIDILEEEPLQANILLKHMPPSNGAATVPQGVLIQVSFRKKAVEPKRVASIYAERLAAKGISLDGISSGSIDYEFVGNRLYLTAGPKKEPTVEGRAFPSPGLVEAFYSGFLGNPGQRLTTRGKQFEVNEQLGVSNLIPSSVAFLLRASGGIHGRKEIHRLLNDQVFGEKRFDEYGYANTPEVQLWRDVPKAGTRIARMLPLFWGRPYSEHFVDD